MVGIRSIPIYFNSADIALRHKYLRKKPVGATMRVVGALHYSLSKMLVVWEGG